MNDYLIIFIILLLLGNIYVSYQLHKSDLYEKEQKVYQFFTIWLIPLLGMCIVLFFLNNELSNSSKDGSSNETNVIEYHDNGSSGDGD